MKKLIYRTDDFGSARAANEAILEGLEKGSMIRNVSVMAPCAYVEEGAEVLARYKNVDIGMHFTITSEWDNVKWGPVLENTLTAGVTDKNGYFKASLADFAAEPVDVEKVIQECGAQLDKLTRLGLPIVYVDSHMMPETVIPGLMERFREWIAAKGLLDAYDYYRLANDILPAYTQNDGDYLKSVESWIKGLPENVQLWAVAHPARAGDETKQFANADFPEGVVMSQRQQEYLSVIAPEWAEWQGKYDLRLLRYSEAEKVIDGVKGLTKLFG